MTALRKPEIPLTGHQPQLVSRLRLAALDCRAAPKGSLRACEMLDPAADPGLYADLLAQTLAQMLDHRPVFWRPGAAGRSFDEDWLLALARAIDRGDLDSERFLLRRRVRPGAVPVLRLMMRGLVGRLDID